MGMFEGRVALVTGGGRGIGRGISLLLAREGAVVGVNYAKDASAADETVALIRSTGGAARAYAADVADPEADEAMLSALTDDYGPLDLLVNNAGVASRGRTVADTAVDEAERLLRIHAIGPHHLCRLALPAMRARAAEWGRADIVFISSAATDNHSANGAPYNMGKAAMEALAFTLAKEEVANNIHVNVVALGLVFSDMGRRLAKAATGIFSTLLGGQRTVAKKSPDGVISSNKPVTEPSSLGNEHPVERVAVGPRKRTGRNRIVDSDAEEAEAVARHLVDKAGNADGQFAAANFDRQFPGRS